MKSSHCYLYLFLFVVSCNIIGEDDIETVSELEALKLTGFTFHEQRISGNSSVSATLTSDEEVNVHDVAYNVYVKRILEFDAPALTKKLKYRSNASADVTFAVNYLANDVPYTWIVYEGIEPAEIYRFRYSSQGRLNKIITIILDDDGNAERHTSDSIIYNGSEISSIVRKSPDGALAGTFSDFLTNDQSDGLYTLSGYRFQNISVSANPGGCSGSNPFCRTYSTSYAGGAFSPGTSTAINMTQTFGITTKLSITDAYENNSCCRQPDTYYFHPLMLWQGSIENGHILLGIYLVDWMQPGPQANGGNNSSESENLSISYDYDN